MGCQLLSVIGVVHGKAIKFVLAARNHVTVLRNIRYSYVILTHPIGLLSLCPLGHQRAYFRRTTLCQAMHWRSGHKNDCVQIISSSEASSSVLPAVGKGDCI